MYVAMATNLMSKFAKSANSSLLFVALAFGKDCNIAILFLKVHLWWSNYIVCTLVNVSPVTLEFNRVVGVRSWTEIRPLRHSQAAAIRHHVANLYACLVHPAHDDVRQNQAWRRGCCGRRGRTPWRSRRRPCALSDWLALVNGGLPACRPAPYCRTMNIWWKSVQCILG